MEKPKIKLRTLEYYDYNDIRDYLRNHGITESQEADFRRALDWRGGDSDYFTNLSIDCTYFDILFDDRIDIPEALVAGKIRDLLVELFSDECFEVLVREWW